MFDAGLFNFVLAFLKFFFFNCFIRMGLSAAACDSVTVQKLTTLTDDVDVSIPVRSICH